MAKDDDLLDELRDRFDTATDEWADIRAEGDQDMKYLSGDPWDPKDKRQRKDAGRPALALDELGQYVNQLINDVRENELSIKVTPIGYGATSDTAQFRQDLIRQIEYRSNAQQAYTTMFENAVQRSYGYLRIVSRYLNDTSFDQELVIEPIVNPNMITLDPDVLRPTAADAKYAFVHERWHVEDYKARFKDASVRDFSRDTWKIADRWCDGDKIQIAEYWKIEATKRKLLEIQTPTGIIVAAQPKSKSDPTLPEGEILREREFEENKVVHYLTNGLEILEGPTEWPGKAIPIVMCPGKIFYVDEGGGSTKKIMSLIRLARDPYLLYCYYRSTEAELVGMTPKTPFIGYTGQFRTNSLDWQKAAHEPIAYLQADPTVESTGAQMLPLPQRQPYDPPIQAMEIGAESARRAIQAAIGASPLPTAAQRLNDKSGAALKKIVEQTQHGTFHFIDHYKDAITRVGEILDDLIPHYYDNARDVTVRSEDDKVKIVRINDDNPPPEAEKVVPVDAQHLHDVTLSTGPSYDSQREEAQAFAESLSQNQAIFPLIADLVVQLKQLGPVGDLMSKRLHAMLPPQIQKLDDQGGQGIPPQVQMQMQQMQQQAGAVIEGLTKEVQALNQEKAAKVVQEQFGIQKAQLEIASRERIAQMQADTQVLIASAKVDAENARTAVDAIEARIHKILDTQETAVDRRHEAVITALDHAHEHTLTQREHEHTLAEQQQAADLAPEPSPTAEPEAAPPA